MPKPYGTEMETPFEKFSPKTDEKSETTADRYSWEIRQSSRGEITIIVTGTADRKAIEHYAAAVAATEVDWCRERFPGSSAQEHLWRRQ